MSSPGMSLVNLSERLDQLKADVEEAEERLDELEDDKFVYKVSFSKYYHLTFYQTC